MLLLIMLLIIMLLILLKMLFIIMLPLKEYNNISVSIITLKRWLKMRLKRRGDSCPDSSLYYWVPDKNYQWDKGLPKYLA